jgi:predicted Zn finger-like uncharacterized protein
MPFQTECPKCQTTYTLADEVNGRRVRCKTCQNVFLAEEIAAVEAMAEDAPPVSAPPAPALTAVANPPDDVPVTEPASVAAAPAHRHATLPWIVGGTVACAAILGAAAVGVAVVLKPAAPAPQASPQAAQTVSAPVPLPPAYVTPLPPEAPPQPVATPVAASPSPPSPAPTAAKETPVIAAASKPTPGDKLAVTATPRPADESRMSPEALEKVKQATVYIHVTYSDGRQASGSGFFGSADKPNLILTNAHVVGMLAPESHKPQKIEITLNSGEKNVKKTQARVLGVDRRSDLAVLDVGTDEGMPKPLNVKPASGLRYLEPVYVFGFPLGKQLGEEITIRPSSVSSLRKRNGELETVQVAGGMDHGNSGGPVVDSSGDVVGVAVAGIEGSSLLNFAIPGERVTRILNGTLSSIAVGLPYSDTGRVSLPMKLEMVDPSNRVKSVAVEVWTGNRDAVAATESTETRPGDSPRQRTELTYSPGEGIARGDVPLPELPRGKVYWLQPVYISGKATYRSTAVMQDCRPELAIERKPANLRYHGSSVARRQLSIVLKSAFRLNSEDDDNPLSITRSADFLERQDKGDSWKLDYKRVKHEASARGKTTVDPGLAAVEANLNALTALLRLDARGNPAEHPGLDSGALLKGLREQMRSQQLTALAAVDRNGMQDLIKNLTDFAEPIHQAIELSAVPLPNDDHWAPGRSWTSSGDRPLPIETPVDLISGEAKITYTYLGQRVQHGKPEAVIDLDSVIAGKNGNESIGGLLRGTATVDLGTGITTRVEIKTVVDIEAHFVSSGKPVRVIANVSVVMDRGL